MQDVTQEVPVKDNFPDDFYEEYARLVIAFGRLEYIIKLCFKSLHGQGFKKGMEQAESKRQFTELCEEVIKKAREELDQSGRLCDLIERAKKLADYRNDTIHAMWTTDSNGQPYRVRPKLERLDKKRSLLNWRNQTVPVSKLRSKREKIENLWQALDVERKA